MFAFAVRAVVCILGNLESIITQFPSNLLICSSWPKSFDLCSLFLYHCTSVCVIFVPLQDLTMKLSLIQSIGLIAKAISQCVKKQGYIFTRKQELINVMLVSWWFVFFKYWCARGTSRDPFPCLSPQDFIKAEPADALRTRVRPLVIITCANLLYPSIEKKNQGFIILLF